MGGIFLINFNIFSFKRADKLYIKILLSLIICIIATIISVSSFLYINFENITIDATNRSIIDNLMQTSISARLLYDSAKTLALQIIFDSDIKKLLYTSPEVIELLTAQKRLDSYRNTTPFVESIYIYNAKSEIIYTSYFNVQTSSIHDFFDEDIQKIFQDISKYKKQTLIPRKIPNPYAKYMDNAFLNVYTLIFYDSLQLNGQLREAVVINISEKWMRQMIDSLNTNSQSNTFIIDKTGTTVISSLKNDMLSDLSQQKYIRNILDSKEQSGYFIEDINSEKFLVSYVSYDLFDWKYVCVTPYRSITNKIDKMKHMTYFAALVLLIAGIILSLIISKKLYKPIKNIIIKLTKLETEKSGNFFHARQESLRNMIIGNNKSDLAEVLESIDNYKINLDPDNPFMLVLYRIDRFQEFCSKYNLKDRNTLKFGIMNIASEVCPKEYKNETVDLYEDQVALLVSLDSTQVDNVQKSMVQLSQQVMDSVAAHLGISLTTAISTVSMDIGFIRDLYEMCINASLYRLILGHGCIILSDKILNRKSDEYVYPVQKEKELINALMLGNMENARDTYLDIINNCTDYSHTLIQSTVFQLAFAINTAIDTIAKNNYLTSTYGFSSFIIDIGKLETIEDINCYFLRVFEKIGEDIENRKNARYDHLLEGIFKIIRQEYADPNLSINTIADSVQMSSVYLGRLFKKLSYKSLSDYILEVRMEKARELLAATEFPVNVILEKTGFISSGYFYTVFKKVHGLTPSEYRKEFSKKAQ